MHHRDVSGDLGFWHLTDSAAVVAVLTGDGIGGRARLPGGERLRPAHLKYKLNI